MFSSQLVQNYIIFAQRGRAKYRAPRPCAKRTTGHAKGKAGGFFPLNPVFPADPRDAARSISGGRVRRYSTRASKRFDAGHDRRLRIYKGICAKTRRFNPFLRDVSKPALGRRIAMCHKHRRTTEMWLKQEFRRRIALDGRKNRYMI
jgi:hypothetical protein